MDPAQTSAFRVLGSWIRQRPRPFLVERNGSNAATSTTSLQRDPLEAPITPVACSNFLDPVYGGTAMMLSLPPCDQPAHAGPTCPSAVSFAYFM